MSTATKLAAYGLALAAIAGGAWAAGTAIGPLDSTAEPAGAGHSMDEMAEQPAGGAPAESGLPGLAVAANGYRLELAKDQLATATVEPFRFRVLGPDGTAVTRFDLEHEKRLHLVVIRRDSANYQHLHPEMAADGTWSADLALPEPGSYRMFADFKPEGGVSTTLGTDVHASGQFQPKTFYSLNRTDVVDGYEVRLNGELTAGTESTVTATVTRAGKPVTDLQPYLGAYGHLVTLRSADLGYLHVHPLGEPGDGTTTAGPDVRFAVEVPTPGRYRLFLDFQHGGVVRTAQFTVDTTGTPQPTAVPAPAPAAPASTEPHGSEPHGHG